MTELLEPVPELPDDTPIAQVRLPTRINKVLTAEWLKTVGAVREAPDAMLLSMPDLGKGSVAFLRRSLGLPSRDGVTPLPTKSSE